MLVERTFQLGGVLCIATGALLGAAVVVYGIVREAPQLLVPAGLFVAFGCLFLAVGAQARADRRRLLALAAPAPEAGVRGPGRAPERLSAPRPNGAPMGFNEMYLGTPPWDIGRPQREFVRLAEEGWVRGKVLDAGCGTGENALEFARRGLDVTGVDGAPNAIARAREKARVRGLTVDFRVGDVLDLGSLSRQFDTITDCGVFHVFSDEERARYVESLRSAVRPGGRYAMLVFSTEEPDWGGPRRIAPEEVRRAFASGWVVESIQSARFDSTAPGAEGHALLARIRRAE